MYEIKKIDLTEFRNKGFLQEANRLFFHPLGLALEVIMDDKNEKVLSLGGVWDYRDDSEGMLFAQDMIDNDKIKNVEELRLSKIKNRIKTGECDKNGIQQLKGDTNE